MANEISGITSIRASTVAKSSGQVTKPDVANTPVNGGGELPPRGKEQPAEVVDTVDISETVTEINDIIRGIQRDLLRRAPVRSPLAADAALLQPARRDGWSEGAGGYVRPNA